MPRGTRPTAMVVITVRLARSITDTLRPARLVIQSSVPRGLTATPQVPSPTGTVAATVPLARLTSDTVSSRKLLTAAMPNPLRHVSLSGSVTFSQRPPWQTSSPLHTSPSLQLVPSGSIWQVGEQQSPAAVLPSSQVSPAAASTMPSPQAAAGMVVVVVVVVAAVVVVVLARVVVVDDGTVVDVVVVVLEVVEVVGGAVTV